MIWVQPYSCSIYIYSSWVRDLPDLQSVSVFMLQVIWLIHVCKLILGAMSSFNPPNILCESLLGLAQNHVCKCSWKKSQSWSSHESLICPRNSLCLTSSMCHSFWSEVPIKVQKISKVCMNLAHDEWQVIMVLKNMDLQAWTFSKISTCPGTRYMYGETCKYTTDLNNSTHSASKTSYQGLVGQVECSCPVPATIAILSKRSTIKVSLMNNEQWQVTLTNNWFISYTIMICSPIKHMLYITEIFFSVYRFFCK